MKLNYDLHRYLWKALDYLYPPICAGCGKPNYRFCPDCLSTVHIFHLPTCPFCGKTIYPAQTSCKDCIGKTVYFSKAVSWAEYGGPLREALHALKFKNDIALADYFSDFLISILVEQQWNFDLVIPVPLSRKRLKERSYNQSALLSKPISRYFQVEYSTNFLKRIKDTGTQVSRSRTDRETALIDAFLGNPAKLKGRKVLLVDDIITTGSTVNNCSKALREAGAADVNVISIAKTMKVDANI